MIGRGVEVKGVRYDAIQKYTVSDHKPVIASFEVDLRHAVKDAILDVEPTFGDEITKAEIEEEREKLGHYHGADAWRKRNPPPPCSNNVTLHSMFALVGLVVAFLLAVMRT